MTLRRHPSMRRLGTLAALVALVGIFGGVTQAGEIELNLQAVMAGADQRDTVSTLVYLSDQVDLQAIEKQLLRTDGTLQQRHELVVTSLQQRALLSQSNLLDKLETLQAAGNVTAYEPFWISNCVRVDATPAAIKEIADQPDVDTVYLNYPIELIEPVSTGEPGKAIGGRAVEDGVAAVRAPEVWSLGFTGTGVLVATLDTGVDGTHPALAARWRGVADPRYADNPEWAWFDPVTSTTFPASFGSHGTHTMGTVCGGAPGDEVERSPRRAVDSRRRHRSRQHRTDCRRRDPILPVADRSGRKSGDELGCPAGLLEFLATGHLARLPSLR